MNKKVLLAIADGLGDRPCKILDYKTPLQFAKKENLNELAKAGFTGIMDLYRAGIPVGTDLGHLILFGYGIEDYPGRGPIEAFGDGISLIEGDIALRCNFATVDDEMKVVDRRAGRIREGAKELAQALNGMIVDGIEILFKEATEHRAVMVLRGKGLSPNINDTDPKKEGVEPKRACSRDDSKEANFTADILNKVLAEANKILSAHEINKERVKKGLFPANYILTRGAGKMTHIEKITEKLGFKACCIASERTVLGVASLAGFDTRTDKSFTGNIDTDVFKKARYAVDALKEYDFVALHFKATDLMGHDNDPEGKVRAIEKYDAMVGEAIKLINEEIEDEVIIALAADHSTPCERREHSGEPVPIVISGKCIRNDKVNEYDEISCSSGGLGRIKGCDFINSLLDYLEVTIKRGN